jgi:hypothetical protein
LELVVAAYTQLRLARACVADMRLPWERRYDTCRLTPVRVHRVVSSLLVELGTPAKAPKPCGRSPGGPKAASLAERNATRRSKRLPEFVKRANARGFATDTKLIAKPLMVKTQAKRLFGKRKTLRKRYILGTS